MAMLPFDFLAVPPAMFTSPRELRKLDRAFNGWATAFMPPFELPVQQAGSSTTAMDIVEGDNAFMVTADAPGFDPQDISIELKEGRLTISGRRQEDKKQEQDGKVVRRERTSVSFSRSFALPDNVREDDISASLDKGVLTVTLPKAEPVPKPQPKRIAVQAAAEAHEHAPAQQAAAAAGGSKQEAGAAAAQAGAHQE